MKEFIEKSDILFALFILSCATAFFLSEIKFELKVLLVLLVVVFYSFYLFKNTPLNSHGGKSNSSKIIATLGLLVSIPAAIGTIWTTIDPPDKPPHNMPIATRTLFNDPKDYPDDSIIVNLEYTNTFNDMRVSVKWMPVDTYTDSFWGEGTIKFTNIKDGSNFYIVNPSLGIKKDEIEKLNPVWKEYEDGYFRLSLDKKNMRLDYKAPELEDEIDVLSLYDLDTPFFFYDLDFDNNKELIIVLHGAGQRGMDIFKVYALKDGKPVAKHDQITDEEPYLQLDGRSRINFADKTINIHGSSGACNSYDKTYRFLPSKNDTEKGKYILERYSLTESAHDGLDAGCNLFVYKVDKNQKLTLISNETLPKQNQTLSTYLKQMNQP
jgi:hypothetical protein